MTKTDKNRCKCPYCDISESAPLPFCETEKNKMKFCSECGHAIPRNAKKCPDCGAKLKNINEDNK